MLVQRIVQVAHVQVWVFNASCSLQRQSKSRYAIVVSKVCANKGIAEAGNNAKNSLRGESSL